MQRIHCDLLFQQPEIFFGSLQQDEMAENEVDLDWGLIFDAKIPLQDRSLTGLFFHWTP